jgi:hypothetical protein
MIARRGRDLAQGLSSRIRQEPVTVRLMTAAVDPEWLHDPQAFITMIMLDRAGIAPDLPWATA